MPVERLRSPRLSSALVLLTVASGGCGGGAGAPHDRAPEGPGSAAGAVPGAEPSGPTGFAHLRDLGYVDWDEGADTALVGVTSHDPARVSPGYDVYTNDVDEAYLCDLAGRRLHTWRLAGARHMETFELLPDGGIVALSVGQCVARLDWSSNEAWRRELKAHHDVTRLPDGSFLALWWGPGREHFGRRVRFDGLVRLGAGGEELERWFSWNHFARLRELHGPTKLDVPRSEDERRGGFDYYHMNSVEWLGDTPLGREDARFRAGNLLVCFRNTNMAAVLDQDSGEVVWQWGRDELELPHMPTMLPNGRMLVFDNGSWRGWSRVVEVDVRTGDIVWQYEGEPRESFFSQWRGSAQRLPNGNTLVCEAERGRVFEVDPTGALVWEFWNPEIVDGKRKRIYRYLRLDEAYVEPILERFGVEPGGGS